MLASEAIAQALWDLEEEIEVETVEPPPTDLPYEDGVPLESPWHRAQINLLIDLICCFWYGRTDFYVGGNMFVYYNLEQTRYNLEQLRGKSNRGPDFFLVRNVDGTRPRKSWILWAEGGRYPDLIIELLSPSTASVDKTLKKELYARVFRTPEYYWYDPDSGELQGWRLNGDQYQALEPDEQGRLWSEVAQLWLGTWVGKYLYEQAQWLRFFDAEGQLVLTEAEQAQAAREAAEARAQEEQAAREAAEARAREEQAARQSAEAELARLRAELARLRGASAGS